jgi:hypothetical protein
MSEKIKISFDDEESNSKNNKEKIEIDFNDTKETEIEEDTLEKDSEIIAYNRKDTTEKFFNSSVDSFFHGNPALTGFYNSELKFPEGIERGFRRKYSVELKDTFLNTILENNKFIVLASTSGSVYFVDRFNGEIQGKVFFENAIFEKTGLVFKNTIYVNSLSSIYKFENDIIGSDTAGQEIYRTSSNYYIWSNLNLCKGNIVFIEYDALNKKANLKVIDSESSIIIFDFQFEVNEFISEQIIIAGSLVFIAYDNKLIKINLEDHTSNYIPLFFKMNNDCRIFYLNNNLYITNPKNELYYVDLKSNSTDFKYTGIKSNYINSLAGFKDNIFIGTVYGWKLYKSHGMLLYSYDDVDENKIEAVSKTLLIISKTNKIVCHNLNKFQEAEGFALKSQDSEIDSEVIESVIISFNDFFVLTKNGKLEAFTNDKLNIHI